MAKTAERPQPTAQQATPRGRLLLFAALVAGCVVVAAIAVAAAMTRDSTPAGETMGLRQLLPEAKQADRPVVLFRSLAAGSKGQAGIVPLSAPGDADPTLAALTCDRVAFSAGSGICLARRGGFGEGYEARIFGPDLRVRASVGVQGIASRARVSPDGRWGSVTLFVTGHSYAAAGAFSTETTLIDLRQCTRIATLEDFTVSRDGRVITAVDRNFWGTTFAKDGDTFYATLATRGNTYLVRGSLRDRTMRTIHRNVECPSLSPDGTRIAYKKRVGSGTNPWRLTVLDLETQRETALLGTEGLDDQAEWLDDDRVLYSDDDAIRVVPADGSSRTRDFRRAADSPAVVRWNEPNAIPGA